MAEQGRTISFQLSTGNVDQLSNVSQTEKGHFVQVKPASDMPFYAEPKVALYAVCAVFREYVRQRRDSFR